VKKIPTLFVRDPEDRRYVIDEVTPGCEWVINGEGTPTRKYDGTCVMARFGRWWARREVKPGKQEPSGFLAIETDSVTGKTVGWEPIENSSFAKFHAEALSVREYADGWPGGTYELIGPKINGNPERRSVHRLIRHATAEGLAVDARTFDSIRASVLAWSEADGVEGIVFHHDDGRMAKIKARDFRRDEIQEEA
jgi:hypothetical protein